MKNNNVKLNKNDNEGAVVEMKNVEVSMNMKKVELVEIAIGLGIDVKKSWNKTKIIEMITAAKKNVTDIDDELVVANDKDDYITEDYNVKAFIGDSKYVYNSNEGEIYTIKDIDEEHDSLICVPYFSDKGAGVLYGDKEVSNDFTIPLKEIIEGDVLSLMLEEEKNKFVEENINKEDTENTEENTTENVTEEDTEEDTEEISNSLPDEYELFNDKGFVSLLDAAHKAMQDPNADVNAKSSISIKSDINTKTDKKEEVKEQMDIYHKGYNYLKTLFFKQKEAGKKTGVFVKCKNRKGTPLLKLVGVKSGKVFLYPYNDSKNMFKTTIQCIVDNYTVISYKEATSIFNALTKKNTVTAQSKQETEEEVATTSKPKYNFKTKNVDKLYQQMNLYFNAVTRGEINSNLFLSDGKNIYRITHMNIRKNYKGVYIFDINDPKCNIHTIDMDTVALYDVLTLTEVKALLKK